MTEIHARCPSPGDCVCVCPVCLRARAKLIAKQRGYKDKPARDELDRKIDEVLHEDNETWNAAIEAAAEACEARVEDNERDGEGEAACEASNCARAIRALRRG